MKYLIMLLLRRYESSPIYIINVAYYADSDGNGYGDLGGIIKKLVYIQEEISVRVVALEGLLNEDDLSLIRPDIGSIEDFKALASKIKVCTRRRYFC